MSSSPKANHPEPAAAANVVAVEAAPSGGEETPEDKNKRIVNFLTTSFLTFRNAITSLLPPESGTIDDMTLMWSARYFKGDGDEGTAHKKAGTLDIHVNTRTPPDVVGGRHAVTDSIDMHINMPFDRDMHPVTYVSMVSKEEKSLSDKKDVEGVESK
jgi:hypothetical protein